MVKSAIFSSTRFNKHFSNNKPGGGLLAENIWFFEVHYDNLNTIRLNIARLRSPLLFTNIGSDFFYWSATL